MFDKYAVKVADQIFLKMDEIKFRFNEKLKELYSTKKDNSKLMSKEHYDGLVASIRRLKNEPPTTPGEFRITYKYDLLCVGDKKFLITKPVSCTNYLEVLTNSSKENVNQRSRRTKGPMNTDII